MSLAISSIVTSRYIIPDEMLMMGISQRNTALFPTERVTKRISTIHSL